MIEPGYRLFYRIVKTNPPTLSDFESAAIKGRPLPSDPGDARLWDGLSVYSTPAQARRQRRRSPVLGAFIATVRVPLDESVRVERTRGDGHHTLWGDAELLLSMVTAIGPV